MKKILLILALLALPALADNPFSASVTSGPVTINAQCSTPTTGCASGQAATLSVAGRNSIAIQIITSNFTGTIAPYYSVDYGVNWVAARLRTSIVTSGGVGVAASTAFAASTQTVQYTVPIQFGNITDIMIASTAAVTNTATVQILATNGQPGALTTLITAKGSQHVDSVGFQTQDLKDSGRTFVVISADGVTPAIAETVITFSQNKAGTVTAGQTTYAITAAKTLRLQSLVCSLTAGAAANRVRVAIRLNTGGACVAGSNLLAAAMELTPTYGTATANEGGAYGEMAIPDGLELTGASWNICLTESAAAASGTLTCTLTGYEY